MQTGEGRPLVGGRPRNGCRKARSSEKSVGHNESRTVVSRGPAVRGVGSVYGGALGFSSG